MTILSMYVLYHHIMHIKLHDSLQRAFAIEIY